MSGKRTKNIQNFFHFFVTKKNKDYFIEFIVDIAPSFSFAAWFLLPYCSLACVNCVQTFWDERKLEF